MNGCDSGAELRFSGGCALGAALAESLSLLDALGLALPDRNRLAILIEELLANQFEHAQLDASATLALRLERHPEHVLLVLEDSGMPFDPRAASADAPIPERGGGAGLALVRAWAESLTYASKSDVNRLELRYSLARPGGD